GGSEDRAVLRVVYLEAVLGPRLRRPRKSCLVGEGHPGGGGGAGGLWRENQVLRVPDHSGEGRHRAGDERCESQGGPGRRRGCDGYALPPLSHEPGHLSGTSGPQGRNESEPAHPALAADAGPGDGRAFLGTRRRTSHGHRRFDPPSRGYKQKEREKVAESVMTVMNVHALN